VLEHLSALIPLAILGIRSLYWAIAAVVVVIVVLLLLVASRRGRGAKLDLRALPPEHASRYLAEMEAAEATFVDNPQQAVARARGLVEEIMRRKGFPDRIDSDQRLRDLQRHDRAAAQSLKEAYAGTNAKNTESMRKALQSYRDVLRRLVGDEAGPAPQGSGVSPEATIG